MRVLTAAAAAFLLMVASGCAKGSAPAGGGNTSGGSAKGGGDAVDVKNFAFDPSPLTVKVGTKVTWTFDDSVQHNVTADDKAFKSPDLGRGKSYSFTFKKAGNYDYTCTIHPQMHGSVVVK